MTKADLLVERAADRLQQLANSNAGQGGLKDKLAAELAEDATFLRKLKPSLIVARAQGRAPTDQKPGTPAPDVPPPSGPSGPQLGARPGKKQGGDAGGGPNPFVVIGAALFAGIVLAKAIDWRGHAHPRL